MAPIWCPTYWRPDASGIEKGSANDVNDEAHHASLWHACVFRARLPSLPRACKVGAHHRSAAASPLYQDIEKGMKEAGGDKVVFDFRDPNGDLAAQTA